jgi:two-component system sensor histidine kinase/response regulator
MSKIESGQNTLNVENCNIIELFNELTLFFNDYKARFKKHDVNLLFQYPLNSLTSIVLTDKLKLKQVLINLISNAFKFTETGSIECGYKLDNDKLQFYVSDTGVGIPADKFQFVFERFSQLKHPLVHNAGGTGLGLPIVKGLVNLLGGKVWIESECNKGTTFYFTINYFKAGSITTNPLVQEAAQKMISPKTILIVEDDIYNAEYLKAVLNKISTNIIMATNGLMAVDIVKKQNIDLVLMDIQLPDITGYEATRLILQHNPNIKIIAQTAFAASSERQIAIETGCIDYISKPSKQVDLLNIVSLHLK